MTDDRQPANPPGIDYNSRDRFGRLKVVKNKAAAYDLRKSQIDSPGGACIVKSIRPLRFRPAVDILDLLIQSKGVHR